MLKKKYLATMLAAVTAAALSLTACGGTDEAANDAAEVTVESTVAESTETAAEESSEAAEPVTYEVCIASLTGDKAMGYAADGTLYIFDLEDLTDEEKALFVEDAVLEVTDDGSEPTETTVMLDNESKTAYVAVATVTASVDETSAAKLKAEMYASLYGYTIEEQEASTKYANEAVTVYSVAAEDADTLGALTAADEVTVTGTTDNGYTQIEYDGVTAYVDSSAIVDEKPAVQEATSNSSSSDSSTGSSSTGSTSTGSTSASRPDEITVDGKTLEKQSSKRLAGELAEMGIDANIDSSKYAYAWFSEDGTIYYYQFTLEEVMDSSTITDLESHLIAVEQ